MRALGYAVTFLPDNFAPLQPYTSELQDLGVEVLYHVEGGRSPARGLPSDEVLPLVDFRVDLPSGAVPRDTASR